MKIKTLLDPAVASEIKARLAQLQPNSPRHWGKMNPAQALAHCNLGLKLALGDSKPPRTLISWTIGPLIKKMILKDEAPLRRNTPTVNGLEVQDNRDLTTEREHLCVTIDRLTLAGSGGCTTHAHSLLGRLTPHEWGILMYKHLDHHLRQFGV